MDTNSRPPFVSSPVPQAWGPPPVPVTVSAPSPDAPIVPSVARNELQRVKSENARLQQELRDIKQQMQQISNRQKQPVASSSSAPDLQTIVAAVLAALPQQNAHSMPPQSDSSPARPLHLASSLHPPTRPHNMDSQQVA
ncbi:hypothetical protein ACA910_002579 [Epithemia clementina (nom. ined.)]